MLVLGLLRFLCFFFIKINDVQNIQSTSKIWTSKILTSKIRILSKSKLLVVRILARPNFRRSGLMEHAKSVWKRNVRIGPKPNNFVRISDFPKHLKFEWNHSDFGQRSNTEPSGTGPKVNCRRMKLVRILAFHCIVFQNDYADSLRSLCLLIKL